jgi:hypothetical protein
MTAHSPDPKSAPLDARRFAFRIKNAVHIDYLRLRCGYEDDFLKRLTTAEIAGATSFIAFSEWDVVLFIPCDHLYPNNLIDIYEDRDVTSALAGSAGYFNYVWEHPINEDWERRVADLAALRSPTSSHVSMLVSLRFTDRFRSTYGIGAELLFCNFLDGLRQKYRALDLFAVHSVGWNDVTVMMWVRKSEENMLLNALTDIRYCTVASCVGNDDPTTVVAASYSHFLGNLTKYVETELDFGKLGDSVRQARLLVRTTPAMEPAIRDAYFDVAAKVRAELNLSAPEKKELDAELGTELGHYNFSADIYWAFKSEDGRAPVKVIQGLRRRIREQLTSIHRPWSSFPETTTEIRFSETRIPQDDQPPREPIRVLQYYSDMIEDLMKRLPGVLHENASHMTRHRVAILLGSISTYLADPVRGSVVGHLCRFFKSTFETIFERIDRDQQEDLCHVLEYALSQATDGLSQFQHDANSLGLSGRGGYVRVIQAMEQWVADLLTSLNLNLMPLITYGLHSRHSTTDVSHRIDIPFSTAFAPTRWPVLFHEIGHMCWHDLFGWRLESLDVWNKFTKGVETFSYERGKDSYLGEHVAFIDARSDVAEIFPNYMMLNVAAAGDVNVLDQMMLYREVSGVPRRSIAPSLRRRIVLHVLLALHKDKRPLSPEDVRVTLKDHESVRSDEKDLIAKLDSVAMQWWQAWSDLSTDPDVKERVILIIEKAINSFARTMAAVDKDDESTPRTSAAYGRTT